MPTRRAEPTFVDVAHHGTVNTSYSPFEGTITPYANAIPPVDAFGQPAKLDVVREIADRHGLVVIEDSWRLPGVRVYGHQGREQCLLARHSASGCSGRGPRPVLARQGRLSLERSVFFSYSPWSGLCLDGVSSGSR
ncbi:MAG: DegT/DnrJ/EryC1/StrS family aminotransferase [Firmicutes bacterium]|nr:DegT/DnrJ/EryC1/StrS family aminotransferase [Bacillota bacterium]